MSSALLEQAAPMTDEETQLMEQMEQEQAAPKQEREEKQEEQAPAKTDLDPETQADLNEAVRLAKVAESSRTGANFKIAALVVKAINRNVVKLAHNADDAAEYREQTIGLFSFEVSKATGLAITAKKMTEYLRAHYLGELMGDDSKSLKKINWEVVRVLVRWTEFNPRNVEFNPPDGELLGSYSEAWTLKAGCDTRLKELVPALARAPKSPKAVRELMDDHEAQADRDELATMTSAARKAELDARQTAALAARIKEVDAFFAGIITRAANLKLSMSEVGDQLRRRKIVEALPAEFDAVSMSSADASRMAKELVQANNLDAAGAFLQTLMPLLHAVQADTQPSKATGQILGEVRQVA